MKSPQIFYILLLSVILKSCWDPYVNSKENNKEDIQKRMDSTKIDSSLFERPRRKIKSPKRNKALDTLRPGIAILIASWKDLEAQKG